MLAMPNNNNATLDAIGRRSRLGGLLKQRGVLTSLERDDRPHQLTMFARSGVAYSHPKEGRASAAPKGHDAGRS
jgi:hypothetical protein